MKKKEARELMKKADVVEINDSEWCGLCDVGELRMNCEDENLYFKPNQTVFENETYKIEIRGDGINISNKNTNDEMYLCVDGSLPLLKEAIKAQENL